jgi:hypothetical protein
MGREDEISQVERRKVMAEELRHKTYMAHTDTFLDDDRGGRFSVTKPATIIGKGPISYPRLPENSPWHTNPLPPEPSLGYSVEDQEPTGEKFEQERASQTKKEG